MDVKEGTSAGTSIWRVVLEEISDCECSVATRKAAVNKLVQLALGVVVL